MRSTDFVMPQDKDAEKVVLSVLMQDRNVFAEVETLLKPECFYDEVHRTIFEAIAAINRRGDVADLITVTAEVKKIAPEITPFKVTEVGAAGYTPDYLQHAAHLYEIATRRHLINVSQQLQADATAGVKDTADIIETARKEIDNSFSLVENRVINASIVTDEVFATLDNERAGKAISVANSGFFDIDRRKLLREGSLIIIAADSSQGKTAFADAITLNATKQGTPMAFYSLEMTAKEIVSRLLSMESRVPSARFATANGIELERLKQAKNVVKQLPLYFDDRSTSSIESVCASIRTLRIKKGIKGAVIDYLQILPRNRRDGNEEAALADAARTLKNLAKQLGIFILLLSQLSRDRDNCIPTLSRLRGSGQVNEAADVTALIYRPEKYGVDRYPAPFCDIDTHGTALIKIEKNRNGECFPFVCGFVPELTLFYDLDKLPRLSAQQPPAKQPINFND